MANRNPIFTQALVYRARLHGVLNWFWSKSNSKSGETWLAPDPLWAEQTLFQLLLPITQTLSLSISRFCSTTLVSRIMFGKRRFLLQVPLYLVSLWQSLGLAAVSLCGTDPKENDGINNYEDDQAKCDPVARLGRSLNSIEY
jgi:hypothetical protein